VAPCTADFPAGEPRHDRRLPARGGQPVHHEVPIGQGNGPRIVTHRVLLPPPVMLESARPSPRVTVLLHRQRLPHTLIERALERFRALPEVVRGFFRDPALAYINAR
jgi:hypothetical protein